MLTGPGRQGGPLGVGEDLGGLDLVQTTPGPHHRLFVLVVYSIFLLNVLRC